MAKKQQPINNKKESRKADLKTDQDHSSMFQKIAGFSVLFIIALLMFLGIFESGGVVGNFFYVKFALGVFGYVGILLPFILLYTSIAILFPERLLPRLLDIITGIAMIMSVTGLLELFVPSLNLGGLLGNSIGSIGISLFSRIGGIVVLSLMTIVGGLIFFRSSFNLLEWLSSLFESNDSDDEYVFNEEDFEDVPEVIPAEKDKKEPGEAFEKSLQAAEAVPTKKEKPVPETENFSIEPISFSDDYVLPPLSLLSKSAGKPSVGDIRAQGNVIKQTLANFGIDVEMDEVSVGPTVTRYAMKPAQGVKLARIVALKQDLALSLAAHPLRIEAPIPGKSLILANHLSDLEVCSKVTNSKTRQNDYWLPWVKVLPENPILQILGKCHTF